MSKADALDFVFAFFMNCYALRDWVIGSGFKSEADVDAFIRSNPDMALCRDIFNGLKLFSIHAKGATAPNWSSATVFPSTTTVPAVPVPVPGREPIHDERWEITTGTDNIDMFDLADRCLAAWDRFLASPSPVRPRPAFTMHQQSTHNNDHSVNFES